MGLTCCPCPTLPAQVRGFFRTKETLGLEWRMGQLKAIGRLINENRDVVRPVWISDFLPDAQETTSLHDPIVYVYASVVYS